MSVIQSQTDRWSQINATGDIPIGRSSNASGIINKKLYVFSGEHDPRNPVDGDMFELNFDTKSWQRFANQPSSWPCARVGHCAATHNGKLFVYGGRGSADSHETMSDFWMFDPTKANQTDAWARLPLAGSHPPPLSYHSMTSDEHHVYVFGGCTSDDRSNQLWAFHVEKQQWTQQTMESSDSQPCPRGGTSIVHAHDGLHVLFGYNGKQEQVDHWLWHADTQQWEQIPNNDGPDARSVTDVVFLADVGAKGSLFVFGGEYTPSAQGHLGAGSYHSDTWLFDINTRTWSKTDSNNSPSARGWFNTVALDSKSAVVFGGFDGKDRLNDVHVWQCE